MLTVTYLQSDGCETVAEYEGVTAEIVDGCRVVHGHNGTELMTWGPVKDRDVAANPAVPTIYVMNGKGATVATYRL